MQLYNPENSAHDNLKILGENEYFGRFVLQGFIDEIGGTAVQAAIMGGRSESSKNRFYAIKDDVVSTEVYDKTIIVGNQEHTIYDTMRHKGNVHIVSNGAQTGTAIQCLEEGNSFEDAMNISEYEDDGNDTPRISGFINLDPATGQPRMGLSLIHKNPFEKRSTRHFWTEHTPEIDLKAGIGYGLHTYERNQDKEAGETKIPSYTGLPIRLPLSDSAEGVAKMLWDHIDTENVAAVIAKTFTANEEPDFYTIDIHDNPRHIDLHQA